VTIGGTSLVGQTLGAALPGLDIRAGAAAFAIPGFAATVGRTYVFQVTMTTVVRLASQSVASAPTSVSALVAVRFVAAPLVARIEGGDRQGMGSGMHTNQRCNMLAPINLECVNIFSFSMNTITKSLDQLQ
jgi:hypothetical protein